MQHIVTKLFSIGQLTQKEQVYTINKGLITLKLKGGNYKGIGTREVLSTFQELELSVVNVIYSCDVKKIIRVLVISF